MLASTGKSITQNAKGEQRERGELMLWQVAQNGWHRFHRDRTKTDIMVRKIGVAADVEPAKKNPRCHIVGCIF
jgi:hypothetical protein